MYLTKQTNKISNIIFRKYLQMENCKYLKKNVVVLYSSIKAFIKYIYLNLIYRKNK